MNNALYTEDSKYKEEEVFEKINKIISSYGKIVESYIQKNNLKHVISYEAKAPQIKIEINLRHLYNRGILLCNYCLFLLI
jgi:hypothetical protein